MPRFSIFTPTHNPQYLVEAYHSLLRQDSQDFEWVIVPNAFTLDKLPKIPEEITRDPRVRVHLCIRPTGSGIGYLKRFSCDLCVGDILVELDHDDLLAPCILGKISAEFSAGADFVYTDTACFNQKDQSTVYFDPANGWETYPVWLYGQEFAAHRSFDITPRSLCEILYAPDHVRCWRRGFYQYIGGHNHKLWVGDDHELVCRSYVAGGVFKRIPVCGYFYRYHDDGTAKRHYGGIHAQQVRNSNKYLHSMIDVWLWDNDYEMVDLSSPTQWDEAAMRIDAPDNSVGCIKAYGDILPRIPTAMITTFMEEAYRTLVPGGYLCLAFPSTNGQAAFAPHYRSYWNEGLLSYYTDRTKASRLPGSHSARFQLFQHQVIDKRPGEPKLKELWSYCDLSALKGQTQPGPKYI